MRTGYPGKSEQLGSSSCSVRSLAVARAMPILEGELDRLMLKCLLGACLSFWLGMLIYLHGKSFVNSDPAQRYRFDGSRFPHCVMQTVPRVGAARSAARGSLLAH